MAERERAEAEILHFPAPRPPADHAGIGDLRFRTLIGEAAWARLPEAIRARFGKRVRGSSAIVYAGEVIECRMSAIGWLLAQAGRLIGGPLPLHRDADVPACVTVTEDPAFAGQFWTRIYGRRRGFPQVISSSKRFAGPTGLEEQVGGGIGIALRAEVSDGALHFLSDHYFLMVRGRRLRLPRLLSPGALRVSHVDCNNGLFAFVLSLRHAWFGELIHQVAMFRERGVGDA